MIFTTNKSLKAWSRVLHDEDLAQAIIDRVLERGRLLRLDGPSVRTLHVNLDEAMKEASDQDADLARISGKRRPEFPEPTVRWHVKHAKRPGHAPEPEVLVDGVQDGDNQGSRDRRENGLHVDQQGLGAIEQYAERHEEHAAQQRSRRTR